MVILQRPIESNLNDILGGWGQVHDAGNSARRQRTQIMVVLAHVLQGLVFDRELVVGVLWLEAVFSPLGHLQQQRQLRVAAETAMSRTSCRVRCTYKLMLCG